jgi:hypothetical protein
MSLVSFLARTRIQAQVLVPVLRALRAEIGKEKADALVRRALRVWSKELFRAIGDGIAGRSLRKWATVQSARWVTQTGVAAAAPLVIFGTRAILPCSRIRRPRWTGHNFHPH